MVAEAVKKCLEKKGYRIKIKRGKSEHGADIKTDYHLDYRKQFIIEAKGEGKLKYEHKNYGVSEGEKEVKINWK